MPDRVLARVKRGEDGKLIVEYVRYTLEYEYEDGTREPVMMENTEAIRSFFDVDIENTVEIGP